MDMIDLMGLMDLMGPCNLDFGAHLCDGSFVLACKSARQHELVSVYLLKSRDKDSILIIFKQKEENVLNL